MIDPKELRIGNLVEMSWVAPPWIVETVTSQILVSYEEGYMDMRPIPISPEWLERLGFDTDDDDDNEWSIQVGNNVSIYFHTQYGFCIHYEFTTPHYHEYNQWFQPEYVHQLQNLFFALTGTELTVKEPAV